MKGKFIVVEGPDLSGKTTFIERFAFLLGRRGEACITTGEPGGSHVGGMIRNILVNHKMSSETRAMLYLANRQDHLETVIKPALSRGVHVIASRYVWSTYALQYEVKDLAKDISERLGFIAPDFTYFLDIPERRVKELLIQSERRMDVMDQELTAKHLLYRERFLIEHSECANPKALVNFNRRQTMCDKELEGLIDLAFGGQQRAA